MCVSRAICIGDSVGGREGYVCAQVQPLCASVCASVCGLLMCGPTSSPSMCPCDRKSGLIEHCMGKRCVERGVDLEADIPGLKF